MNYFLLAVFFWGLILAGPATAECLDSVVIDSATYTVEGHWCGRALDSAEIAVPESLVPLPQELTFEDYRIYVTPATRSAFAAMAEAARKDSVDLIADSGFRSLAFQKRIIRRRLAAGDSFPDIIRFVAPPGYSQHHTGRALDLVPSEARFAHTAQYQWLSEHAAAFGFVETYPDLKDDGLNWESWHWYYGGDENGNSAP